MRKSVRLFSVFSIIFFFLICFSAITCSVGPVIVQYQVRVYNDSGIFIRVYIDGVNTGELLGGTEYSGFYTVNRNSELEIHTATGFKITSIYVTEDKTFVYPLDFPIS